MVDWEIKQIKGSMKSDINYIPRHILAYVEICLNIHSNLFRIIM